MFLSKELVLFCITIDLFITLYSYRMSYPPISLFSLQVAPRMDVSRKKDMILSIKYCSLVWSMGIMKPRSAFVVMPALDTDLFQITIAQPLNFNSNFIFAINFDIRKLTQPLKRIYPGPVCPSVMVATHKK